MPSDESFQIGNSDIQRGSTMGGGEYIGESNICNNTDHPGTNFGSNWRGTKEKDIIFDRNCSVSSAVSGTADTLVEGFKDNSTVVDKSGHDANTVTFSGLNERKLLPGEHNGGDSQGQVYPPKTSFEEDPCISRIFDVSGQYMSKLVCATDLDKDPAFQSDTRHSAGPELSESQIPELSERESVFQNGDMKEKPVMDVSTSSMFNGRSPLASLASDVCHCVRAEDGNAQDKQESTDTQKITCPVNEFDQDSKAVGTDKCICWQKVHDKRLEQGSDSSRKSKTESFRIVSENDQVSLNQSNDSHDHDHHLGITLYDNSGSTTAMGGNIVQMSEMRLATNTSMNDKEPSGHKQENYFESVHLNSCGQSNINESNASCLQETSHINFDRIDDEVQMITERKKDEEREATLFEMENRTGEQENVDSLSVELRELKGDTMEPDSENLLVNAKISDSNDLHMHKYEPSPKEAEEVPHNSFEDTTDTRKIDQQGMVLAPSDLGIAVTPASNDKGTFEIIRAVGDEKQDMEDQGCGSGLPTKGKHIIESSNSLRLLLSADDVLASDSVDKPGFLNDRVRKDREAFEHPHRVLPSSETGRSVNHRSQEESHAFPGKWYEDAEENEFTSATFSGPIAYSGTVSYSGPIPYSGSISYRSDSSASTRSFAFPILASDWTSSPVKMSQPDSRFFKRRKRWRFSCFCCKRSSTLYD